jgi:hypothetical protein
MIKKKMPEANHMLIEYFDAKFNLLIDGYVALDKKIDDFRAEVNEKFREIDTRLDAIETLLDAIEIRLQRIDDQFEVVFEELHDLHREQAARTP